MNPTPTSTWYAKRRYHHGSLRESALQRGREIVAVHGPAGLTLRGLARDLGVTAPALVYHFGSIVHLRAAVAQSVLEQMEAACNVASGGPRRPPHDVGADWIAFATSNANLYRLASGEGWSAQKAKPNGFNGPLAVPSPRRLLEDALLRQTRSYARDEHARERSGYLALSIHGLALARLDGVPEKTVARGLDRAAAT